MPPTAHDTHGSRRRYAGEAAVTERRWLLPLTTHQSPLTTREETGDADSHSWTATVATLAGKRPRFVRLGKCVALFRRSGG